MHHTLRYNASLDGLRAIAVMMVVFHHGELNGFFFGYAGVDIFFVLSGYLITSTLLKEYDETGRISFARFYRRRALRLLPALTVVCVAFFAFAVIVMRSPWTGFVETGLTMSYVANWTRAAHLSLPFYLAHSWSLAVEEQYYLVWPFIFLSVTRLRPRWRPLACLLLAAGVAIWRAWLYDGGTSVHRLYNGTDTRADALLIGSGLAFALSNAWLRNLVQKASFAWPLGVLLFWYGCEDDWADGDLYQGGMALLALGAAVVIANLATMPHGFLARLAARPILVWVGQRSYGIYLWHGLMNVGIGHSAAYFWPVYLGGTFGLAALSYRYVETPFLNMRYRCEDAHPLAPVAGMRPEPLRTTG